MIDEGGHLDALDRPKLGVRTAVMSSLDAGKFLFTEVSRLSPVRRVRDLGILLRYGTFFVSKRKRRIMVNVDELVDRWITAIVGLCLAHDKDTFDAHDAAADKLLGPLLSCPVKQLREFYQKLLDRMAVEPRVPFLVRMGFDAWGEYAVRGAPDEAVKRLKNKLAQDISDLVEEDIKDQIPKAIQRALRWRDPETLQAVKETLESGVKPKLVGRQSCLFLEMRPRGKKPKVSVML